MVDTLHYVKDKASYATKLREGLAPCGRVVIIDYRPKLFEESVDEDFAAAGLKVLESYDFLPEQYFVVYGRAEEKRPRLLLINLDQTARPSRSNRKKSFRSSIPPA